MPYKDLLTQAHGIAAGQSQSARDLLDAILQALDTEPLTIDERRRLYKLRKKWTERANGRDLRWNAIGSKPGRPKTARHGKSKDYREEEECDPLVASILRKFGTPLGDDV